MRSNFGVIWESRKEVFVSRSVELLWFIIVIIMIIVTITIDNIDNFSARPSLSSVTHPFFTKGGQSMNDAAVVEAQGKKVFCISKARQYKSSAPRTWLEWTPAQSPFVCNCSGRKLQP